MQKTIFYSATKLIGIGKLCKTCR